jgi:hypothetical protein
MAIHRIVRQETVGRFSGENRGHTAEPERVREITLLPLWHNLSRPPTEEELQSVITEYTPYVPSENWPRTVTEIFITQKLRLGFPLWEELSRILVLPPNIIGQPPEIIQEAS